MYVGGYLFISVTSHPPFPQIPGKEHAATTRQTALGITVEVSRAHVDYGVKKTCDSAHPVAESCTINLKFTGVSFGVIIEEKSYA